jgi:hypothetical protein
LQALGKRQGCRSQFAQLTMLDEAASLEKTAAVQLSNDS